MREIPIWSTAQTAYIQNCRVDRALPTAQALRLTMTLDFSICVARDAYSATQRGSHVRILGDRRAKICAAAHIVR